MGKVEMGTHWDRLWKIQGQVGKMSPKESLKVACTVLRGAAQRTVWVSEGLPEGTVLHKETALAPSTSASQINSVYNRAKFVVVLDSGPGSSSRGKQSDLSSLSYTRVSNCCKIFNNLRKFGFMKAKQEQQAFVHDFATTWQSSQNYYMFSSHFKRMHNIFSQKTLPVQKVWPKPVLLVLLVLP